MNATQDTVDRAIGDCTTQRDVSQSDQHIVHEGNRLTVDDDHDEIEALELPDDWKETDLEADAVEIEGADFE